MILTGCAGASAGNEPEIGPVPTIRSNADVAKLALPLDPYMDNLAFNVLIERASDVLAQRCMQRFGLTYPSYRPVEDPNRPEHLRRWGIADKDEAARYGYVPAFVLEERMTQPPPAAPVSRDADAVAAGLIKEYHGLAVPDRGCFGEAADILNGGTAPRVMGDVALPRRLADESYERSLADSRVKAAFREWSACMRRAGFRYRHHSTPARTLDGRSSMWHSARGQRRSRPRRPMPRADCRSTWSVSCMPSRPPTGSEHSMRTWTRCRSRAESSGRWSVERGKS